MEYVLSELKNFFLGIDSIPNRFQERNVNLPMQINGFYNSRILANSKSHYLKKIEVRAIWLRRSIAKDNKLFESE